LLKRILKIIFGNTSDESLFFPYLLVFSIPILISVLCLIAYYFLSFTVWASFTRDSYFYLIQIFWANFIIIFRTTLEFYWTWKL